MSRAAATCLAVLAAALMACPPPAATRDGGAPLDPRCVPDGGTFAPQLQVLFDGGLAFQSLRMDEVATVQLDGLPPCTDVRLTFSLAAGASSTAVFSSGFDGVVNTALHAPTLGTWTTVDPTGPLWSMLGDARGDPTISISADINAGETLDVVWQRRPWADDRDALPVRGYRGVWGDLYVPAGTGPFPAVLVLGRPEGGARQATHLAQALLNAGFVTFGVWYVDPENPALPATLERVPLEYLHTALEVLKESRDVRPDRLGVIGLGRGGEAALLLAAQTAELKAVVAVAASGVAWPAPGGAAPAWTSGDAGVAFLPLGAAAPTTRLDGQGRELRADRPVYADGYQRATPAERAAAEIAVERIAGPVLLLGAGDDQVWPSCVLSQVAFDRLRDGGHPARYPADALVCHEQAGHALNPANVGLPAGDADVFDAEGTWLDLGGTARGTGHGNRAAWQRTVQFLDAALKTP
ncbi:MAG: acyl-CoA thioesterase/BAAT N-terminal domain-containing protein [Archangium sp.]|nr:acyl-CoA thioesterase/BAAT N-terminal domain-containing protein [Archangium sp.]